MADLLDFDVLAAALGVPRDTLPKNRTDSAPTERETAPRQPAIDFKRLSDVEWEQIAPLLPRLPVAKPDSDFRDRDFIDSVLFWLAARERGFGWAALPREFWPVSSREHRWRRWVGLGYWETLAAALRDGGRLDPSRRRAFERIARDAEARSLRAEKRRERLTDA